MSTWVYAGTGSPKSYLHACANKCFINGTISSALIYTFKSIYNEKQNNKFMNRNISRPIYLYMTKGFLGDIFVCFASCYAFSH